MVCITTNETPTVSMVKLDHRTGTISTFNPYVEVMTGLLSPSFVL